MGCQYAPSRDETAKTGRIAFYAAAAVFTLALTLPFLGMEVSEDAGYYGFVSRAMAAGYKIHRDFPVGQNSLAFYLNAAVFRLFGASPLVLRLIYAFWGLLFSLAFCNLAEKFLGSRRKAFIAFAFAAVLVFQPQLQRGLGRNNLLPVLFFLALCARAAISETTAATAAFCGFCAGAAAVFNESLLSFAPFALATLILAKPQRWLNPDCAIDSEDRDGGWRGQFDVKFGADSCSYPREILHRNVPPAAVESRYSIAQSGLKHTAFYCAGFLAACLPFAATLLARGAFPGYVRDMFYLGVGFRVSGPYSSRVGNLISISWDLFFIYGALILLCLAGIWRRRWFVFFSGLCFTVLVVNATRNYHLLLLAPFAALAAAETVARYYEAGQPRGKWPVRAAAALFIFINLPALGKDYMLAFRESAHGWAYHVLGRRADAPDAPTALAGALDSIPYKTISTSSEYPALFMAKRLSVSKPCVEDLSLARNSAGMITLRDMVGSLRASPADVFVGKRSSDNPSHLEGFIRLFLKNRYIRIADLGGQGSYSGVRLFAKKTAWRHYRHDIYYSLAAFGENFGKTRTLNPAAMDFTAETRAVNTLELDPRTQTAVIIEVIFPDANRAPRAWLECGLNKTAFDRNRFQPDRFHLLAPPGREAKLSVWSKPPAGIKINFYAAKR